MGYHLFIYLFSFCKQLKSKLSFPVGFTAGAKDIGHSFDCPSLKPRASLRSALPFCFLRNKFI